MATPKRKKTKKKKVTKKKVTKKAPKKRIVAWSFSRFDDYQSCPLKAYLKHVEKMKDPNPGPALARGRAVHESCEDYLLHRTNKMPTACEQFADLFKELRTKKFRSLLQVENELAFTKDWVPTGWFDSNAWLRIKTDLMYDDPDNVELRHVKDWKTGRENPKHRLQLDLYAIGAFLTAPRNIKTVKAQMVYLDSGSTMTDEYQRVDVDDLKREWLKRTKKMLSDTVFKPTPSSFACRWCFLSKSKGGPCKF